MAKDFDEILDNVGGFGRYQKKMMLVVVVTTSFLMAIQVTNVLFQVIIPDHWCSVPGRENTSMSSEQWKNFTIPTAGAGADTYEKCEQYTIVWVNGTAVRTNQTQACVSWEYDRSLMRETVASSFDWVCDRSLYSKHILSGQIAGNSVSTLILPLLADRYTGRRVMFFVSVLFHAVFSTALIWTGNFGLHFFFRFMANFAFQTNYQMSYLIALELLSPDKRALAAFMSFLAWTFGMCLSSYLSWLFNHWQLLVLITLLPNVYFLSLWWYLPESPRWLLTRGRVDKCTTILLKVAAQNGQSVKKETLVKDLEVIVATQEPRTTPLAILNFPVFRNRALSMLVLSASAFLGYGCLVLNINVVPNRYFLNYFLLSVVELPSNISGWIAVQYLGRRFTGITTYILSIFISLAAGICVQYYWALVVLVGLLKWVMTVGLYVLYIQVTELYPTPLRSTGMGAIAVFGMGVMTVVPYIINEDVDKSLSYWIIAGTSVISVLCLLPLPETLGLPLPQTLKEANNLGCNRPLRKWVHKWNINEYDRETIRRRSAIDQQEPFIEAQK